MSYWLTSRGKMKWWEVLIVLPRDLNDNVRRGYCYDWVFCSSWDDRMKNTWIQLLGWDDRMKNKWIQLRTQKASPILEWTLLSQFSTQTRTEQSRNDYCGWTDSLLDGKYCFATPKHHTKMINLDMEFANGHDLCILIRSHHLGHIIASELANACYGIRQWYNSPLYFISFVADLATLMFEQ